MNEPVILDTGPLVACINRRDRYHEWARIWLDKIEPPLFVCEPVLAEACFILQGCPGGSGVVLEWVRREVLQVEFQICRQFPSISKLMTKYGDVPMSLADSCLVRMSELIPDSRIMTLDSDFRIYRRHGRQVIPLITPEKG